MPAMRVGRLTPSIMALSGILLLVLWAVRLPADISDLLGNLAVETLSVGEFITPEGAALALAARRHGLTKHQTADRWFVAGRAYLVMGHAQKAADAFASGLVLAPGRGSVWAEYARALDAAGDHARGVRVRRQSFRRAAHDPKAIRLRRN
jgi:cytochrome c-type biogenesis protein CcmH/NrfG